MSRAPNLPSRVPGCVRRWLFYQGFGVMGGARSQVFMVIVSPASVPVSRPS